MEFFHEPKIDWMGKKWYFIGVSIPLLVAGLISIAIHRGLVYGIDFRGGTVVTVKFAQQPNLDAIRRGLDAQGLRGATVQQVFDPIKGAASHEFIISLDLQSMNQANALDAGKQAISKGLSGLYGTAPADKVDFNNANTQSIAEHLESSDPLHVASKGTDAAGKVYADLAGALVKFRNDPSHGGLVRDFKELSAVPGVTPAVLATLSRDFYLSSYAVRNTQIVGPKVGADLRRQALYVTLAGLGAMLVYIWYRFELIYGIAAVIATFHDVLITLGIFSLLNKDITLTVIAALLTLVGYSMNDTIVEIGRAHV